MSPFLQVLDQIEVGGTPRKLTAFDISGFTPVINYFDNDILAPMGDRDIPRAGAVHVTGSLSVQCAGSGSAGTPPPENGLLVAAGLDYTNVSSTSDTYVVAAGTAPTSTTVNRYMGSTGTAQKYVATDVLTNPTWEILPNQPVKVTFDCVGRYSAPSAADPAGSAETKAVPVVAKNLTATVASDTLVLKRFMFSLNNEFDAPNEDIASANGVAAPNIVDLSPTAEVEFELPALSTQNYWTDAISENGLAISVVVGASAGNIMTITMTGYLMDSPAVSQVQKKHHITLPLKMGRGSGEPFKIIYT